MRPQISYPPIHNGASPPLEHSSGAAYTEFLENLHKLYGDLDDHSQWGYDHT